MKTLYDVTETQFGQIKKINAFFVEKERELRAKMLETRKRCEKCLDFFVSNIEGEIGYDDRFGNISFFRDMEDGKFAKTETIAFLVRCDDDTNGIGRKVELALCTTALQFGERYDESDILDFDEGRVSLNIRLELSSTPQKPCRKPVFEDIPLLDSYLIERVFERVETEELAKAIFSAPITIKNKFFCNLYEKEAESLKKAMESLDAVTEAEIENARGKIAEIMGELADYWKPSLFPNLNYEEKSELNGGDR